MFLIAFYSFCYICSACVMESSLSTVLDKVINRDRVSLINKLVLILVNVLLLDHLYIHVDAMYYLCGL